MPETFSESEQLKQAIKLANIFLKSYDDKDRDEHCWGLLSVLVEYTEQLLEADIPAENLAIDSKELLEKCSAAFAIKAGRSASKFCNRLYLILEEKLDELNDYLIEQAREINVSFIFYIGKKESAGGYKNRTYYFFGSKEIDERSLTAARKYKAEKADFKSVTYTPYKTKLPFYSKWLTHLTIGGSKKYLFLLIFLSPFLTMATLGFLPLLSQISETIAHNKTSLAIYAFTYSILGAAFFWPIYRLLHYRVIRAPDIIAPNSFENVLLEFRSLPEHEGKGKRFVISTYRATCPVCKHPIELAGGGFNYFGRIVGRCTESPREHIYSFDHVTRVGRRLR